MLFKLTYRVFFFIEFKVEKVITQTRSQLQFWGHWDSTKKRQVRVRRLDFAYLPHTPIGESWWPFILDSFINTSMLFQILMFRSVDCFCYSMSCIFIGWILIKCVTKSSLWVIPLLQILWSFGKKLKINTWKIISRSRTR